MSLGRDALRYLAFMVWKHQVETTSVYVESLAEIFRAHGGAFEMPSRETFAPRRGPMHYMLRSGLLPEGEIERVALLVLPVERTGGVAQLVDVASGKLAVAMVFVVFLNVEVDRTLADIGISGFKYPLDVFYLLYDMPRSVRLDARRKHVERIHVAVVAVQIHLHHLHRLKLLETGFLRDFVLAGISVMLQMAHIGDVAHIAHLQAEMTQIAVKDIKSDGRTGVAQMGVAIDSRAADIHAHVPFVERREALFRAA